MPARTLSMMRLPISRRVGLPRAGAPFPFLPPLFLLIAILGPRPAAAYDPLTIPSTPVRRLEIDGNRFLTEDDIRDRMNRTKGGFIRSGRYRPRWLENDLEEVIRYYTNLGFLDARVAEKEVAWNQGRESVDIRILFEEGERTLVDSILFVGLPELNRDKLRSRLSLTVGSPYNREAVGRERIRVFAFLGEQGYAEAEVGFEERLRPGAATLVYVVDAGPKVRIGPVRVVGCVNTRPRFVTRELLLREGDWYNRRKLLESRDRVYRTGLYYNVAMTLEPLREGNAAPLRIDVREKDNRWFGFGGGFGTEDLFRFSLDWTNRNWFRTGRRLGLETVFSELLADRPFEQRYELTFIEPWMFGTRTAGTWRVSHERMNVENFVIKEEDRIVGRYRLDQTATSFTLTRELSDIFKAWITYSLEWADAKDPSEPVDPDLLRPDVTRALSFTVERDARDHLLDPTRGNRFHTSLEFAGSFLGGDNEFLKGLANGAAYKTVLPRTVIAGRLQVGGIRKLAGDDALPDYKRFRLGGANTVRGYREQTIGPSDVQLLANVEVRFHILWRIGGVLFLDGGNTWSSWREIRSADFRLHKDLADTDITDFRYGAGGGLRIYTPVGPLRVDYARKLKPRIKETGETESRQVFHFSIGQAF
ncbi:MAG: BamA/TamA family outer membrane protein [Candidatus Eisenbacteria bacterium]